jgi:acid phosphatase
VSTNRLGQSLRELYVDQLRFLPSTLPNVSPSDSPVFFRSTAMPRTMESLFGIIGGLYPEGKREGTVQFTVRKPVDESLYPNSLCGRMKVIDREFAARAAKEWNGTLVPLDGLISKYIDG